MGAGLHLCKCGLLLFLSSLEVGGGTQILFQKQEDSLSVKLCTVYVTPFPLFHEFFGAGQHLSSTTVFFFFSGHVKLDLERPQEYPGGGEGGGGKVRQGEE